VKRIVNDELWVPALVLLLCATYVWQTFGYPTNAIVLPYATIVGLVGLASVVAIVALKDKGFFVAVPSTSSDRTPEKSFSSILVKYRGLVLAFVTICYVLALPYVGYFFSTAVYLFCLFWLLGNRKVFLFGPAAGVLAALASYVMQDVLQINVPTFPFANLPFGM
jgi:hypothetical protein